MSRHFTPVQTCKRIPQNPNIPKMVTTKKTYGVLLYYSLQKHKMYSPKYKDLHPQNLEAFYLHPPSRKRQMSKFDKKRLLSASCFASQSLSCDIQHMAINSEWLNNRISGNVTIEFFLK